MCDGAEGNWYMRGKQEVEVKEGGLEVGMQAVRKYGRQGCWYVGR